MPYVRIWTTLHHVHGTRRPFEGLPAYNRVMRGRVCATDRGREPDLEGVGSDGDTAAWLAEPHSITAALIHHFNCVQAGVVVDGNKGECELALRIRREGVKHLVERTIPAAGFFEDIETT